MDRGKLKATAYQLYANQVLLIAEDVFNMDGLSDKERDVLDVYVYKIEEELRQKADRILKRKQNNEKLTFR